MSYRDGELLQLSVHVWEVYDPPWWRLDRLIWFVLTDLYVGQVTYMDVATQQLMSKRVVRRKLR